MVQVDVSQSGVNQLFVVFLLEKPSSYGQMNTGHNVILNQPTERCTVFGTRYW